MEARQYILYMPPDRAGVTKLAVVECDKCHALVPEDLIASHQAWHTKLFFGAMA